MSTLAKLVIEIEATKAMTNLRSLEKTLDSSSKNMLKMGAKIGLLTAPLALFAKRGVQSFVEFDGAMTKSTAIMGDLSDTMVGKLREQALMLSNELPISAKGMAESYYYLASAGMNATESMQALPIVAKFATAGNVDMALATELLASSQTALGLRVDDTAKSMENLLWISDLFARGNQLSMTSMQQLGEAMQRDAGATIKMFGLDLVDSTVALMAFADAGVRGAMGGNTFGRMVRLLSASAVKNKEAFEDMNIHVFGDDKKIRSFVDIYKDFEVAFAGMAPEIKIAKLELLGFSTLASKSILPLIGMSDAMAKNKEKMLDVLVQLTKL